MDKESLQIIAWCTECGWWLEEESIGTRCPSPDCNKKLVKRKKYICSECSQAYRSKKSFKEHECFDLY